MPRLKTVFSSHSQVAHVWAQQQQSAGRAGNMFFRDSMIFSYGDHYCIAKIHTIKGKRFALINAKGYSSSTAQHTNHVIGALRGLMPMFFSMDVLSPKEAVKYLDARAQVSITRALKLVKVPDKDSIQFALDNIRDDFETATKLRALLGRAPIRPTKKQLAEVSDHLEKRLVRYQELNTPEMIAKRQAEADKRKEAEQSKYLLEQAEKIAAFERGEHVQGLSVTPAIIRIKGDIVQTSRGAEVPLDHAKRLLALIELGEASQGERVGHFTLNSVQGDSVVIGCHELSLTQARKVLKSA